jgi:hypothetical protein
MSERKKAETKTAKASKTKKAEPKPKREKPPKEELVVFALRMTEPERVALHKAAGPANASRVMRAVAGAFVAEDRVVFERIVEDARKLRP